ncbi:MAG: hypothetical protein LIO77_09985 [Rikenellaceae bacterium]|nr:hypothetical protein [Rikenellaceae bacterium]
MKRGAIITVASIVLGILIVLFTWLLIGMLNTPRNFQREVKVREAAVISRIQDIRTAQQAYKQKYQRYTPTFDSLIYFVLNDSLVFERSSGSVDDSIAVARGLVTREEFWIPVIDTIFRKQMTRNDVENLRYIPYGEGAEYIMDAGTFETDSKVVVPVFEAKAPFKAFLGDLNRQELINYIDDAKTLGKYPGIKVGALDQATNDAGNWE